MAEPLPKQALDSAVNPTKIVQQKFDLERRGFDQRQVQAYLRAVADSLRDAQNRESEMRSRLGKAIRRAEAAEQSLRDLPANDPSELTRQIGDEVTTVLDAARAAGDQRIAAAEKSAEALMANAKSEATKIRGAAETIMDERRSEADAVANEIIAEAESAADELLEEARSDSDQVRADAANRVAHIRDECDALIHEAEEARGQILEDMERRRRQARAQVERLRVGRDRLLRSYDVVRRTLEETTMELKSSLHEAKVRGDTAGRLVAGEPLADRVQLESELADAKLIGAVRVTDPKVLQSPALPRPIDPPQVPNIDLRTESAPTPRKPQVTAPPRPPAVAPTLKASPAGTDELEATDETAAAETDELEATDETAAAETDELEIWVSDDAELQEDLAGLADGDLDVIEPTDEIEAVTPVAEDSPTPKLPTPKLPTPKLFAALRQQRGTEEAAAEQAATVAADLEVRRDAIIADAAGQFEKRLKRALADEQNDLLAGIRAAKKRDVELTALVGDLDSHLKRYVVAINEVAAVTYGAGAALVDAEPREGELPAGAVEEVLTVDVVEPIRDRLQSLDALQVESLDMHLDPVRAFYRQRKTEHLGAAASRLAKLLCIAGVCDALPDDAAPPWNPADSK